MDRLRPGGEEQRPEGERAPVVEADLPLRRVEGRRGDAGAELQLLLLVELGRPQRDPVLGRLSRQVVLRQIRTIDRRRLLRADEPDRSRVALAPQRLRGDEAGGAGADDDDRVRVRRVRGSGLRGWRRQFLADTHPVPVPDHLPGCDRIERGRPQVLAVSQSETGVVPRTSDRVAHEDPFRERSPVVRARRSDREDLLSAARKERGLAPDVAEEHASVRDLRDRHAALRSGPLGGFSSVVITR